MEKFKLEKVHENKSETLYLIRMKTLIESNLIKKYKYQRYVNEERVSEIVKYQNNCIKKYGEPRITGNIVVCQVRNNLIDFVQEGKKENPLYIIDGQHRYEALCRMIKDQVIDDFIVRVEYISVENEEDLLKEFQDINKSVPVPVHYYEPNELINRAVAILSTKLPDAFRHNQMKVIRPRVDIDKLKDALLSMGNLQEVVQTPEELVLKIEKCNKGYGEKGVKRMMDLIAHKNIQQRDIVAKAYEKCQSGQMLYLGIFKSPSDWVDDLINF